MVTGTVIQNLLMGAILAVFILLLFFERRQTDDRFAYSIPLSVIFAVVLMYFTGITLKCNLLVGTRTWSGNACGQLDRSY